MERIDQPNLISEELPSLSEFAEEAGGAWPVGWYKAMVIDGYATRKGTVFTTEDTPSRDGQSRNMRLCLNVTGAAGTRNTFDTFNYRISDFTPARLEQIKELRQQFKGTRGAWPGQADAQRTSLAIANLGQLEKALGFRFKRHPEGYLVPGTFVGQKLDIRLGVDDKGYNEVTAYAAAGSRTGK